MKSVIVKAVKSVLIIAACLAWLTFAVRLWNTSGMSGTWITINDVPLLRPLWRFLGDRHYSESAGVYFSLAGFLFFTFYMTVLLPKLMKRFFSLKGKNGLILRIIFIVLVILAAYFTVFGSLNKNELPGFLVWMYPDRSLIVKNANLYLIPVSLFLIVFTWCLPALVSFIKNAVRHKIFKKENVLRSLGFYGMMIAAALLVTGFFAAVLAAASTFFPHVVADVSGKEIGLAKYASGVFLTLVLAPFIEETAFRGLMQHHVKRVMPAWFAIVFSAVCFGVWHRNIAQFLYTVTGGIIFGIIYNTTGKLRHTIMIHMFSNFFAILAFSKNNDAVFGKCVILPGIQNWLVKLPFFPAVLMLLFFALLIVISMEIILFLATGKENRIICRMKKKRI